MRTRLVVVSDRGISRGRCKYCKEPVLWATRASQPGRPAKALPFNPPRPWPLSVTRNDEIGLVFETWPTSALHFTTCTMQPPRRSKRVRVHA